MPPVVKSKKLTAGSSAVALAKKKARVEQEEKPKHKLKADATEFVSRTDAIVARLDRERALNPITDDSDATYEFYKATLAETLELIPIAKLNYLNYQTSNNAYAYNGLVTKAQELLADLEALADKGHLVEKIISQLVTPAFIGITANIGNAFIATQGDVKALQLPPNKEEQVLKLIAQMIRTVGSYLQDTSDSLNSQIRDQFDEN